MAQEAPSNPRQTGPLIAGLLITGVGLVVLASQLGVIGRLDIEELWPLFPVAVGASFLASAQDRKRQRMGGLLMVVGTWMLISTLGLFDLYWDNSWPVLLLMLGVFSAIFPKEGEARSGSYWLFVVGIWGLVSTQGWFGFTLGNSWPLMMIAGGGALVWEAVAKRRGQERGSGGGGE